MKKLFLMILVVMCNTAFSQSPELELESVKERFEQGEFVQEQYQKMAREWQRLMDKFDGYPLFPLNDTTNEIEFVFVDTLVGHTKKDIYNRALEYTAIHFGSVGNVLKYDNYEAGKIIIKGNFKEYYVRDVSWWLSSTKEMVAKIKCDFTVELTIKREKLKTKITNPKITNYYFLTADELEIELPLSYLYPITNSKLKEWENRLEQLMIIRDRFYGYTEAQLDYILNKESDYDF